MEKCEIEVQSGDYTTYTIEFMLPSDNMSKLNHFLANLGRYANKNLILDKLVELEAREIYHANNRKYTNGVSFKRFKRGI